MDQISKQFTPTYIGTGRDVFWLVLKTGLLTLLTLGIYRFWAKTRVRRYIWSSTKIDGDGFEYTGTGLEKFLGFLVALVVLAVYLGILQILFSFAGFSLLPSGVFEDNEADMMAQVALTYATLLAVLPLMLFATYRSRRYMMARTRWRGIRMGMAAGAWGYTWRALGLMFLQIITLGLLTPLVTFKLHKFMTDRTYFGDTQFAQGGKWTALFPFMIHFVVGGVIVIVGTVLFMNSLPAIGDLPADTENPFGVEMLVLFIGYFWLFYGNIHYSVHSFKYMQNHQTLGEQITFSSSITMRPMVAIYLGGFLLVMLIATAAYIPGVVMIGFGFVMLAGEFGTMAMGTVLAICGVVVLMIGIAMIQASTMALLTQPILEQYLITAKIHNAQHIDAIQQRAADRMADADGFADALDIGGAI